MTTRTVVLGAPKPWYRFIVDERVLSYLVLIFAWQVLSLIFPPHIFPPLQAVLARLWEIVVGGAFLQHAGITLFRVVTGMTVAFVIGTVMGIVMGVREYWDRLLNDYVTVALSVPGLIWGVLVGMWFGLHPIGPVLATTLGTFPFIATNVYQGVRNIDKELIDMAAVYRVSRERVLRRVIIPSLVPYLFAAVRYALGVAWKVVVLAEVWAATDGLGYMIQYNFDAFSIRGVIAWAAVFTIVLLGVEHAVLRPLERRVLRWRAEAQF